MSESTNVYADIIKMDENEDGTLTVYGKATDSGLDIDQQICDPAWLDTAMPEWFMTGGNIREQHSNIAAGVAQEYQQKADGHYISALVVDPVSVKKVKNRVLRGFSIGIKSPRVVKDTKAANGRIIDGQIVEVSLVDRPANPNCQIVLAKSVEGEAKLIKVEEMTMNLTIKDILADAKKYAPAELVKFDKDLFDKVRIALAQLIMSEANEMITEGSNEEESLAWLLGALHSVFAWYEHEEAEGEVMEMKSSNPIADTTVSEAIGEVKADGTDICAECGKTDKECKCEKMDKEMVDQNDAETDLAAKSASHKCLECGCNTPQATHGLTRVEVTGGTPNNEVANVSTATMISPDQTPKSAEPTENSVEETSTDKPLLADVDLTDIVEKAVKSAMSSVEAEVALLKSAKEAVENKATSLETELATAKSLAIGGGPKRTTIATGANKTNEWKAKADLYFAKASSTTDQILAKGYRDMAKDFLAKSEPEVESK